MQPSAGSPRTPRVRSPQEFARLLQEMQLGVGRTEAMRAMAERTTLADLQVLLPRDGAGRQPRHPDRPRAADPEPGDAHQASAAGRGEGSAGAGQDPVPAGLLHPALPLHRDPGAGGHPDRRPVRQACERSCASRSGRAPSAPARQHVAGHHGRPRLRAGAASGSVLVSERHASSGSSAGRCSPWSLACRCVLEWRAGAQLVGSRWSRVLVVHCCRSRRRSADLLVYLAVPAVVAGYATAGSRTLNVALVGGSRPCRLVGSTRADVASEPVAGGVLAGHRRWARVCWRAGSRGRCASSRRARRR